MFSKLNYKSNREFVPFRISNFITLKEGITNQQLNSVLNDQLIYHLNNNQIIVHSFNHLKSMKVLQLFQFISSIQIKQLTLIACCCLPKEFPHFTHLQKLDLSNNFIQSLQFIQNISAPQLLELILKGNSIFSLKALRKSITPIKILSCQLNFIADLNYLRQVNSTKMKKLFYGNKCQKLNSFDWIFTLMMNNSKLQTKFVQCQIKTQFQDKMSFDSWISQNSQYSIDRNDQILKHYLKDNQETSNMMINYNQGELRRQRGINAKMNQMPDPDELQMFHFMHFNSIPANFKSKKLLAYQIKKLSVTKIYKDLYFKKSQQKENDQQNQDFWRQNRHFWNAGYYF